MVVKDVISSVVVFLFSLTAFLLAKDFGGGAELFPRGLAIIMMAVSVIMFVRAVFWPAAVPKGIAPMEAADVKVVATCVALTLIYIALIVPLGFLTASVLFIAAVSYSLGMRNHPAIWLTAFGFVGCLWFLFVRIFHTPLPADLIARLFS